MLGSGNGRSLMLGFEAMLPPKPGAGAYVGMMPVLWSDEHACFEDLITSSTIGIERA